MTKNRVSLRQNFTTMKIKTYNTKEEARAAFRRSIEMRAEYEAKVRQKWEEMKSSINPANAQEWTEEQEREAFLHTSRVNAAKMCAKYL